MKNIRKKLLLMAGIMAMGVCLLKTGEGYVSAAEKLPLKKAQIIVKKNTKVNLITKAGLGSVSYKKLSFSVKKKSIAKVSKKGILRGKKSGTTTVVIKNKSKGTKGKINVKVVGTCTQYTVKKSKTVSISTVLASNQKTAARKVASYKWSSRNSKIVKIVEGGKKIKAKKSGTTYVVGTSAKKEEKVILEITVGKPVKQINLATNQFVVGIGSKTKINYTYSPASADNDNFYYEISAPGVISISSSGKISAKKAGEATVTMRSADGHAKAVFSVMVVAELIRNTAYGRVEGTVVNSQCIAWFGVPYAQPPVGELRWRAPQELSAWSGILATKNKKSKAAQAETTSTSSGSEDCLYLNIYRPNSNDVNLPVMVYIHGGSNISGSSAKSFKNLAIAANAIIVTVEYRLGAFGWLNIDALKTGNPEEDSGNFALLDIKKALQWVKYNIGGFGGNMNNITISGFSAGARNTLACIISPLFKGLFDKAIIFSGGMTTYKPEDGEESAKTKLANILVKRGIYANKKKALAWLNQASKEEIKTFLYSLSKDEVACMYTYMGLKLSNAPQLFADGYVIPKQGFDVIASGNYNAVPMIFGSSSQEFATYALSANYYDSELNSDIIKKGWNMLSMIQSAKRFGSMYQSYYYIENNAEKFLASGIQPAIYSYRFEWGNDPDVSSDFYADFLGSYHGTDVNFLVGSYKNEYESYVSNVYNSSNAEGRKALTSVMQNYIGNFLKNGNPNGNGLAAWNNWNPQASAKIMVFDASANANASYMSSMYYRREDIDNLMKSTLSVAQCDILNKLVFAGRYFMPADNTTLVPDDESDEIVEGNNGSEVTENTESE